MPELVVDPTRSVLKRFAHLISFEYTVIFCCCCLEQKIKKIMIIHHTCIMYKRYKFLSYVESFFPVDFYNDLVCPDPLLLSTTCCLHAENGQYYEPFCNLQVYKKSIIIFLRQGSHSSKSHLGEWCSREIFLHW